MRYAVARFNREQRDMAYRIYVTDCLRIISRNTCAALVDEDVEISYMKQSYYDIIAGKKSDTRTGAEIADDVLNWICGGDDK